MGSIDQRGWLKLVAVMASVLLLFAACGNGDTDEPTATDGEDAQITTREDGVLTVGSDIPYPPFEFRQGGELTGYDVELVDEIASRLGLGSPANWVPTDFETIFTQLAAGQFDVVASGVTITDERSQIVNFSIPYYNAQQSLVINSAETPDITSTDDLGEGDSVAVQRGTTGEDWARENLEDQGVEIRSFPQAPDTYAALEAGDVTGVIFDEPSGAEEASNRSNLELVEAIETGEEYGFAVDPQNEALLDEINRVLQEMIDDGTYQEIYDKYFEGAPAGSVAG
jgi:polar amino acid transport system substrate-binding protein